MKLIVALFLLCSCFAFSQINISLDGKVKDYVLNSNTGIVIVKTSRYLYGIDPNTNNIKWESKPLSNEDFSNYSEIPFTPYIIFESKPFINSKVLSKVTGAKGVSKTIVNCLNGNVLFDSETQNYKAVLNSLLIPEIKGVLVNGLKKENEFVIGLYNYETSKIIWESNITNSSFFKALKGALFDDEKIEIDAHKNIYWLNNRVLLKIDGKTGKLLREIPNVNNFLFNESKDVIYILSNKLNVEKLNEESNIEAFDTKSDTMVWQTQTKISGNVSQAIINDKKLVVITSKGFDIINVNNGKKQWEQSDPLPLIKKIIALDSSFIVVQQNFLNRVNIEGHKMWKEPVKILHSGDASQVHISKDNNSIIYITSSFANKIDLDSGTKLWNNDVVLNDADFLSRNLKLEEQSFKIWYDIKANQFPVYSKKKLYLFRPSLDETPKALFEFNSGRQIPNLNIRENGYFFSLNNKYQFFNLDGNIVYEKEYAAFENKSILKDSWYWLKRGYNTYNATTGFFSNQLKSTFKSVLVSQNLAGFGGTLSSVYGTYESYKNSLQDLTSLNSLGLGSDIDRIFDRIKKAQSYNDTFILLTRYPSRELNSIVQLTISSGEDKVIKNVHEDQTNFIIDQVEKLIYFFNKNEIIIERIIKN